MLKIAGWVVLSLALVFVLSMGANAVGLVNFKFWAPKYEDAKREVFENTQSFVHGKVSHLNRLRLEYESAQAPTRKAALRTMILQEAATVDVELLPASLRAFINQLEKSGGLR